MDKDFVYGSAIWAGAIVLVFATIIIGCISAGNFDNRFDIGCLEAGKSIVYTTLEGEDYARKECR